MVTLWRSQLHSQAVREVVTGASNVSVRELDGVCIGGGWERETGAAAVRLQDSLQSDWTLTERTQRRLGSRSQAGRNQGRLSGLRSYKIKRQSVTLMSVRRETTRWPRARGRPLGPHEPPSKRKTLRGFTWHMNTKTLQSYGWRTNVYTASVSPLYHVT